MYRFDRCLLIDTLVVKRNCFISFMRSANYPDLAEASKRARCAIVTCHNVDHESLRMFAVQNNQIIVTDLYRKITLAMAVDTSMART
jgi:hypothetical protein